MFKFLYNINPFYKGVVILVVSFLLSFTYNEYINIGVFIMSILLIAVGSKKLFKTVKYLIPMLVVSTGLFFSSTSEGGGLILATRVFAFSGPRL